MRVAINHNQKGGAILEKNYQLLNHDNKIFSLKDEKLTSLEEAVGILAICTYEDYKEYKRTKENKSELEREKEEKQLAFQSNLLNSLSNALMAVTPCL